MATVEITGSAMLRPSGEASGETVPLTVFDMAATDGYIPTVFAFHAPAPANEELKEGLLKAVKSFPHLAGRMVVDERKRLCFRLNNDGISVAEATASADLADVMAANVSQLYPSIEKGSADDTLFRVQLTRCRCGSLVVGTSTHHQVADGHSMSTFFAAWASTVREAGAAVEAAFPAPFLNRAATAVPRHPPTPTFDHRSIEFRGEHNSAYAVLPMDSIKNLAVHFPAEFIGKLKARVGARCSTFQCILAHVWKKMTAARDLKPEEITQVRVAVNCRGRSTPPVPMGFFGNMVLWAFPKLQVRDLLSSSYTAVVATIRDAVARVDADYVQSFVDFGEAAARDCEELIGTAATPGTVFCPDLEVDSWLGFGFHNLDFGTGPPCAFLPPDLPIDGITIFLPSCTAKGGVDLFMAMCEEHVKVFKQICYSLD